MIRSVLFALLTLTFGPTAYAQSSGVDPKLVRSAVDAILKESYYPIDETRCRTPLEEFVKERFRGRDMTTMRQKVVDAGCLDPYSNIFPPDSGDERSSLDETNVVHSWRNLPPLWYIQILSFTRSAALEFDKFLGERRPNEKIILDLRGNSGGFTEIMMQIAEHFSPRPGAPTFLKIARDGKPTQLYASKRGVLADNQVVVLVDRNTASAGEMLAGVLRFWNKDRKSKVLIVGGRTFGKTASQEFVGGHEVHRQILLTTTVFAVGDQKYVIHIDRVGLAPDVPMDDPTAENTMTFALRHFGIIPKAK